jgi:hypothetical protein
MDILDLNGCNALWRKIARDNDRCGAGARQAMGLFGGVEKCDLVGSGDLEGRGGMNPLGAIA